MRKLLLLFVLLASSAAAWAQDVIVKKDGSTVVCRVVEITETEVVYKKWNDLQGANYVLERSSVSSVSYQDGKRVDLSTAKNLYKPNNQNDGTQQYNDNALLAIDAALTDPYKKVKTLRIIGWIGGAAIAGTGIVCAYLWHDSEDLAPSIALIGGGVAFTTSFLLIANHQKKKVQRVETSAIYQYDFKLSKGSFLSAGIDMLRDNTLGQNSLGLGLRYNF